MNESKGTVCSTDEVRAILNGKTQFRSVIDTSQFDFDINNCIGITYSRTILKTAEHKVGDILYVKEDYARGKEDGFEPESHANPVITFYLADGDFIDGWTDGNESMEVPWEKAEDMPKEYARIFQKVTAIRVERLQDISVRDIEKSTGWKREIYSYSNKNKAFYKDYVDKWDSEHKDGEKFIDNPIYVIVEDREMVKQ